MKSYIHKLNGASWRVMNEREQEAYLSAVRSYCSEHRLRLLSETPEHGPIEGMLGFPKFYFWRSVPIEGEA